MYKSNNPNLSERARDGGWKGGEGREREREGKINLFWGLRTRYVRLVQPLRA